MKTVTAVEMMTATVKETSHSNIHPLDMLTAAM